MSLRHGEVVRAGDLEPTVRRSGQKLLKHPEPDFFLNVYGRLLCAGHLWSASHLFARRHPFLTG